MHYINLIIAFFGSLKLLGVDNADKVYLNKEEPDIVGGNQRHASLLKASLLSQT